MRAYVIWKTDTEAGHDIWESAERFYFTDEHLCVVDSGQQLRYAWKAYKSLVGGIYDAGNAHSTYSN